MANCTGLNYGTLNVIEIKSVRERKCSLCAAWNECPCGNCGWCEEKKGFKKAEDACPEFEGM